ncbi:hypothetical protein RB195_001299 [Necator americanus]|uniref:Potassium channel domain-containing protein n=1 Tax=Necator americanus TaxID=51031 RepID=A0ABR1DDM4_NECAM
MVVAVAVYVIAGAFAIREIEAAPNHNSEASRSRREAHELRHGALNRTRKCVLAALQRLERASNCSQQLDVSHLMWLDECYKQDLRRLSTDLSRERKEEERRVKMMSANVTSDDDDDGTGYEYWSVMDSVLFCFTVITTIGYGNVAPRTFNGRLFVILYGLVGVPFTMLAIANLGKFLATVLKSWTRPFVRCARRLKRRLCKPKYTTKEKQRLMEKESRKPVKESCRPPKRKKSRMAICTYNARTLASETAIEDLMMQAKKIKYDVIGLTETRRRHPLNAVYETGEELFLGTCDSRGVVELRPRQHEYGKEHRLF